MFTKQQTFDLVWAGLSAQRFLQSASGGSCQYRGDYGRKCAAGHLIPDDKYVSSMESGIVLDPTENRIMRRTAVIKSQAVTKIIAELGHDLPLVRACQKAHDNNQDDPGHMQEDLRGVAKLHGLTVPADA